MISGARSYREAVTTVVVLAALVVAGYSMWRWNPSTRFGLTMWARVKAAQAQIEQTRAEMVKARGSIPIVDADPVQLAQEKVEAEAIRDARRGELDVAKSRFASNDIARQAQNVAIAELARLHQVRIVEVAPYSLVAQTPSRVASPASTAPTPSTPPQVPAAQRPNATTAPATTVAPPATKPVPPLVVGPFVDYSLLLKQFDRPVQKLVLEGSFTAQREFLAALDDLPQRVSVLRFELERLEEPDTTEDDAPLRTTLVLLQ